MNHYNNKEIPKGMTIPHTEASETQPVPFHLGRGNYVAAIYQALQLIPVNIRILQCRVVEREALPPEVELVLHILGEKEAERLGPEIPD